MTARPNGIRVAVPHLPIGLDEAGTIEEQRSLVRSLLAEFPNRSIVFWYYTPMAVAFSAHLPRNLTVYDNMDELSALRGASPELLAREELLLQQADVVFTGGISPVRSETRPSRQPPRLPVEHRYRPFRKGSIGL